MFAIKDVATFYLASLESVTLCQWSVAAEASSQSAQPRCEQFVVKWQLNEAVAAAG